MMPPFSVQSLISAPLHPHSSWGLNLFWIRDTYIRDCVAAISTPIIRNTIAGIPWAHRLSNQTDPQPLSLGSQGCGRVQSPIMWCHYCWPQVQSERFPQRFTHFMLCNISAPRLTIKCPPVHRFTTVRSVPTSGEGVCLLAAPLPNVSPANSGSVAVMPKRPLAPLAPHP